nr:probable serine/threonine protein kinase IREH1 [Tanacetum cinerariifolium]
CLEDLNVVTEHRKFEALTVETFGARIEKLIRVSCFETDYEVVNGYCCYGFVVNGVDYMNIYAPLEDDVVGSLKTSPIHLAKDRTSIDDFEIIKPISRGAFGQVFLVKKRTTGDLFAIKVCFFYSFTCRENLYLVMEYLNDGDLYLLMRNLGCLDEDVARVYIAEVLTDFGLSKVGLINNTDDLSGPAVSGTSLIGEHDEFESSLSESQQLRRKKWFAVGTPDYLAPKILLGTGHGSLKNKYLMITYILSK